MQLFTVKFQQCGVILALFIAIMLGGAPQMWGQTTNDEVVWVKYPENLLPGFYYNVRNAVYSPDGQTILVSFTGEEIGWHKADIKCTEVDAITGAFIREVPIQGIIQFSADGEYVYTFDWKKVRWPSLEVVGQFPLEETPSVESHNFAIDEVAGVLLIVGNDKVGRFDLNTFEELPSSKTIYAKGKYPWVHMSVYVLERGKYFSTFSMYSTPSNPPYSGETHYGSLTWDIRTMDTTNQYPIKGGNIKYSPDGKWIGCVGESDSILFYNAYTYTKMEYGHLQPDSGGCNTPSATWSHDSRYFITSSGNCNTPASIVVWDVQQGTAAYRYKEPIGGGIDLHVSKDDKYVLGVSVAALGLFNFLKGTDVPLEPKVSNTLYPNPTNGNITIPFNQPVAEPTIITVQDSKGAIVKELFNQYLDAGQQNLTFNVADLSQGIYFVRVQSRHNEIIFKMIVEK